MRKCSASKRNPLDLSQRFSEAAPLPASFPLDSSQTENNNPDERRRGIDTEFDTEWKRRTRLKSAMTSRERMLSAMRLEEPDMVPVSPDVSNMIPCRLTGKPFWDIYMNQDPPIWKAYLDAVKRFGFDGCLDKGPFRFLYEPELSIDEKITSHTDERIVKHIITPPRRRRLDFSGRVAMIG